MSMVKKLIKMKIDQLTADELVEHASKYGFMLSKHQAKEIIQYYQTSMNDPFDGDEREKFFKQLSTITDHQTAQKARHLFNEIIQHYSLEHLFHERME